jgi:hypothetical protein
MAINPFNNSQLSQPSASSASTLYKEPGAIDGSGNFLPRIVKVDGSTGCTLTNASIKGMTPAEFEGLSNKEIDLARVIASAAEAKILGVQEKGLPTLLRSSITNIKPLLNQQKVETQSLILPYIQRRQRSYINSNYFAGAGGEASPTAGSGGEHPGSWQVTVDVGDSPWATDIKLINRYFLPGSTVIVSSWDKSTKAKKDLVYKVTASADATSGSDIKAKLTLEPNITASGYSGLSSSEKKAYQFEVGVIQTGANSVNDYEEWCYNQPSDLSNQLIVNWLQTTRESRIVDDQYKATLDSIMSGKVNPFLQNFVYQPIAEQNKRASQLSDEAWMRSVWYGQRINENQTPETYMNLPSVVDPEGERQGSADSCVLEYKSNALGLHTQLADANRIVDRKGQALDLDYLFQQLYYLKRNREADGDSISVIDVMTDRITANNIFTVMNNYYKAKYGWEVTRNVEINGKVTHDGIMLFNYNKYDIPEVGVQLAVFHDQYFDDLISATPSSDGTNSDFKSRSRALWLLDWSDIRVGIAGTNSVTRRNPAPEVMDAYRCRMSAVIKEYSLRSTTWTTMVDRPQRHLIIQGFSDANPLVTTS